jgi:hypothetical protein
MGLVPSVPPRISLVAEEALEKLGPELFFNLVVPFLIETETSLLELLDSSCDRDQDSRWICRENKNYAVERRNSLENETSWALYFEPGDASFVTNFASSFLELLSQVDENGSQLRKLLHLEEVGDSRFVRVSAKPS